MVCSKCEKKLTALACPDTWKAGSRNSTQKGEGQRAINENKLLAAKKKNRATPYGLGAKCKICRSAVTQREAVYCQDCAYKKGICAMCGKIITDTKDQKQSTT